MVKAFLNTDSIDTYLLWRVNKRVSFLWIATVVLSYALLPSVLHYIFDEFLGLRLRKTPVYYLLFPVFAFALKKIIWPNKTNKFKIERDKLTITKRNGNAIVFEICEMTNLEIVFNYFKKNDTEPRDISAGNNNWFSFYYNGKRKRFEFLLTTEWQDNKFREYVEYWESIMPLKYETVLADAG